MHPTPVRSLIDTILLQWELADMPASPLMGQQIQNTIDTMALNDAVLAHINRALRQVTPAEHTPEWLVTIDETLLAMREQALSWREQSRLMGRIVSIWTLLTPLVYADDLMRMRVCDDALIATMELAFLTRLAIPRSAIEAQRIYDFLVTLPHRYERATASGIQIIDQPFRAQMYLVALVMNAEPPGSAVWEVQRACLEQCPAWLLDYPAGYDAGQSARPAFWMAYFGSSDPTFRAIVLRRGGPVVHQSIETMQEYHAKRATAAAELGLDTPSRADLGLLAIPSSPPEMDGLFDDFERLIQQWSAPEQTRFHSGVSQATIDRFQAIVAPLRLPDALASLYRWHNGTQDGAPWCAFPGFFPLEDALATYRELNALGFSWCRAWFPVGRTPDGCWLIPLSETPQEDAPLLAESTYDPIIPVQYDSLAGMLRTYLAAAREGAWFRDPTTGHWMIDDAHFDVLRVRHNPQSVSADHPERFYTAVDVHAWPEVWQRHALHPHP